MPEGRDDDFPARIGPYRIVSRLGRGGMAVVFRARHEETDQLVALKTVSMPRPATLGSIRREIYALSRIQHPGVVRIYGQGVEKGVPWYAMEYIEADTLRSSFHARWPHGIGHAPAQESTMIVGPPTTVTPPLLGPAEAPLRFTPAPAVDDLPLVLVRRLCATLSFLHGEGIVHRDLKPENVLIRDDETPVLVDFGLVSMFGGTLGRESMQTTGEMMGTIGYMAPEQIRGELVDARADLYALGCILYEVVTGRPPFLGGNWEVVNHHLYDAPLLPSVLAEVKPPIERLIMRLLAKAPRDRLGHADDVARALDEVLPHEKLPALPSPRAYLYRPAFTGRAEPLARIEECLDRALAGTGQRVLIAGESGSGKTRLAMEVTRAAIGRSFQVITGECVPVQGRQAAGELGGAPLHPFRTLLQSIADVCRTHGVEMTERLLGRRGRVLAQYDPALVGLPGQDAYPEPASLPPQGARQRVLADLAETLAAFARQAPLLLVLDDLQWADELTLALLAYLRLEFFARNPLVIVGTYRSEEVSDTLLEVVRTPPVTVLELDRLAPATIGIIVGDMLAIEAPPGGLVGFLATHSEGNPFFVAEYLRTAVGERLLYRDAGGRWQVNAEARDADSFSQSLPLPSSMHALVRRRLDDLAPQAVSLVDTAAVLGREFELELAASLAGLGEAEQMAAVKQLLTRQVLEEIDGARFRFVHDKLREVAYDRLSEERRKILHGVAARALEARYTRGPVAALDYPSLAHHFALAGEDARALEYLGRAGEVALRNGAHAQAANYLTRALELDERRSARSPGGQPVGFRRARWRRMLGEATFGLGDVDGSHRYTRGALEGLARPLPETTRGWLQLLGTELARQAAHRLLPETLVTGAHPRRQSWLEGALAAGQLASTYYFTGESLPMVAALLLGVNLAERAGSATSVTQSYARLAYVAGLARLDLLARGYFARAYALADENNDASGLAFSRYLDAFYQLGRGRYVLCQTLGEQSAELLREIGDRQDAEIAETIVAHALYYSGRIEEARRRYRRILDSARVRSNVQHEVWGLALVARSSIALGEVESAIAPLEEASKKAAPLGDRSTEVLCEGLLAWALLVAGERERPLGIAARLGERLRGPVIALPASLHAYLAVAEVHLLAWDRAVRHPAHGSTSLLAEASRRACHDLKRFTRVFPFARPALLRCEAALHHLEGRSGRAREEWDKAIRAAIDLGMPLEESLARHALARSGAMEREDAAASELERARAIFTRLGALRFFEQLQRD